MIKRLSNNSIKLCCGKKGCPIVEDIGDGLVKITDDEGNEIIVKKEEAELISDGVKTLNGDQLLCG